MHLTTLIKKIKNQIDNKAGTFDISCAVTKEPVPFNKRQEPDYKKLNIGDSWGELFDCAWFKLTAKVDVNNKENLWLKLDMNCEALLFGEDGVPLKGFTNGSSAFGHMGSLGSPAKRYYPLNDFVKEDGNVTLWLDAGMNDLFGNVKKEGRIETAEIVARDLALLELYYDIKTIVSLKTVSLKRDKQAYKIYSQGLNKIKRIAYHAPQWVNETLSITKKLLSTQTKSSHEISSIGHAHLDLAWLWPLRETRRKGARTFANVLRLMEQYPTFRFGASQPQLYQWIKTDHSKLYEQIKQRVKSGQWETQGGMWVEADTNISGEEALVRQMLYGIRFFKQEFNVRVKSLWLPDVFGYSGNMPQIIKKSGLDYFMTIKISWNDTTKFPYHTFTWQGIDNSEVFAHMPPEGEYNSPADAFYLLKSAEKYKEKHLGSKTLNLFGIGDGGGGPSPFHIENIRRLSGTAPMPKIKMEKSSDFFERLSKQKDKFPTYSGELYLEKHRGTYTSQGRVKYFNRKTEQKLKTVEILLVQTNQYGKYKEQIENIWKEILLYQFHDILPGSSIKRVYDECVSRYEMLHKELDKIVESILGKKAADADNAENISVYNPLLKESVVSRNTKNTYEIYKVAPMSNSVLSRESFEKRASAHTRLLESELIKVVFNKDGSIKSIYDKTSNKNVLRAKANQLKVYKDIANAWDIYRHYRLLPNRKAKLTKTEAFAYGGIKQIVQYYKYNKSTIQQTITLKSDERFVEFDLEVDWQDNKRMLRTAFPLNLQTDTAVFDIQFGHIKRSTQSNTKALRAQYEASGHNWCDMTGGDWGAAVITDCKYGFKAKNNTLDLHLIKSTNHPAEKGDIGYHRIKYGLLIHSGNQTQGKVDEFALQYNTHYPITTASDVVNEPIFTLSDDSILYSTVKQAEDTEDVIIRLYEPNGASAQTTLKAGEGFVAICETNMVEENAVVLSNSNETTLQFVPFEIKTIMLKKRGN